jgi:hypothetical protein
MKHNSESKVDSTRRQFVRNAGVALAAPLAMAAATGAASAGALADDSAALKARLARLEAGDAIRALQRAYAQHLNAGTGDAAAAQLFTSHATVLGLAGARTLALEPLPADESIEISSDGVTATARLPCTLTTETPIEPSCPLVEMARAQGGGVTTRMQRGVLESRYVKQDGVWKIARVEFRA